MSGNWLKSIWTAVALFVAPLISRVYDLIEFAPTAARGALEIAEFTSIMLGLVLLILKIEAALRQRRRERR